MKAALWLALPLLLCSPVQASFRNPAISPGGNLQPFTSNVVSGAFRGQQHCFVCGLILEHPAVLLFARGMNEPTTRLVQYLDDYMHAHLRDNLLCWTVFLGPAGTAHEVALENQADAFVEHNHIDCTPITVLGDPQGPPGYRLPSNMELVALVTHGRHIIASHEYPAKAWNDKSADALMASIQDTLKLTPATASR